MTADINPYEVLGVSKDAALPEIKSAHRKLVLKCHPDKIQDESQRSKAQDQFQKVQQAYEILSDETSRIKYDQKVRLAELQREVQQARGSSYSRSSATSRECRDGRIYEERVPPEERDSSEFLFDDHDRYFDPRSASRKNDAHSTRTRARTTEEKRKTKAPSSATYAETRTSTKAARTGREKLRTRERRRETSEKYAYTDSMYDTSSDDEITEEYAIPVKRPSAHRRHRETSSRPTEPTRESDSRRYADDEYTTKHQHLETNAANYIRRSRESLEPEQRRTSSRSPRPYDSIDPDLLSSQHPRRTKRSSREPVRPSTSRSNSYEDLDSTHARAYEPTIPTLHYSATFPTSKGSPAPRASTHQPSRSATSIHSQSRSKRDHGRSETVNFGLTGERASRPRHDKYDSGYGSSSPVADVLPPSEPSPKSTRYKIVEPNSPPPYPLKTSKTYELPHERRPPMRTSTTYAYTPEHKPLYGEVDGRLDKKDLKYIREIRPDVTYINPGYPSQRRQSAY